MAAVTAKCHNMLTMLNGGGGGRGWKGTLYISLVGVSCWDSISDNVKLVLQRYTRLGTENP